MNKFRQVNIFTGEPITDSPWMFTATTAKVKCPKCGSDPGFYCETPKGRQASEPHTARCQAYRNLPDFDITKHEVKCTKLSDLLKHE